MGFLFRQSHLTKFLMENFDRVKNYHYIKNKTQWKMWKLSDEYQKKIFFHFFRFPPSQFFLFTFPGLDFHNLKFPHIHAIIKISDQTREDWCLVRVKGMLWKVWSRLSPISTKRTITSPKLTEQKNRPLHMTLEIQVFAQND